MAVPLPQGPEENWDDDFEFNLRNSRGDPAASAGEHLNGAPSTPPLAKDRKNTLRRWTEAGPSAPSTPSKRASLAGPPTSAPATGEPPENWDDDFRDSTDSPARTRTRPVHHADGEEHENWDDDFDDGEGRSPTGKSKARWGSSDDEEDDYGFAASEEDRTVTSRSRGVPLHLSDTAPPPVPPLPSPLLHSPTPSVFSMPVSSTGHRDSTAFSTNSHVHLLSTGHSALALLPPSPPIHRERRRLRKKSRPPHSGAPGVYELEELPDDLGQALARPQEPSTPEMKRASLSFDEQRPPPELPQPTTPGPSASTGTGTGKTPLLSRIGSVGKKWGAGRKKRASTGPTEVALQEHPAERGREQRREQVSRPQSVAGTLPTPTSPPGMTTTAPQSKGSWFFRGGGGGGPGPPQAAPVTLEHKTSVDKLLAMAGLDRTPPASPHKGKSKANIDCKGANTNAGTTGSIRLTDGSTVSSSALFFGTPKRKPSRPMSVQAPQLQASSSQGSSSGSSWMSNRPPVPRHASYGHELGKRSATPSSRASSKQRSASASVEDVSRSDRSLTVREGRRERGQHPRYATDSAGPSESESAGHDSGGGSGKGKEGSRSFMGGMRRISLGGAGKHRRTASKAPEQQQGRKSSGAATIRAEREPAEETTPRPPSRVIRTSQDVPLLPPIELQPPSPPRHGQRERDKSELGRLFKPHPTLEPSRSYPALSSSRSATPLASRPSAEMVPSMSPIPSPLPSPTKPKLASSPGQAASLGRATQPPKELENAGSGAVPRRNSLGDLKIPARISQAQVGLRRDLGMVREFAASIEQLKQLQETYHSLVGEIQSVMYGEHPPGTGTHSRALTPTLFGLPKPPSRVRSNTNPAPSPAPQTPHELILAFHNIENKYQISWECAELLVDLGSGASPPHPTSAPTSPPPESAASSSAPAVIPDGRKSRERAITLAGDEPKPILATPTSPPLASPGSTAHWRASTGRHDLSSRQLLLLREMLNNPDTSATIGMDSRLPIPEEEWHSHSPAVNRTWHWGDPMSSTVTLPSEDGTQASGSGASAAATAKKQKRRSSKLGMRGIRDMLKSLKKSYAENPHPPSLSPVPPSTTSISASTESSANVTAESWHQSLVQRRRAKTSTGPESMKSTREKDRQPNSPYGTSMSLHRSSPRRPSLASIFRIGQKNKSNTGSNEQSSDDLRSSNPSSATSAGPSGVTEEGEEDWDQVESAFDLEKAAAQLLEGTTAPDTTGTATVRGRLKKDRGKGKSPYLTQRQPHGRPITPRSPEASQSSVWSPEPSPRRSMSALPPPANPLGSPTSRFKQLTSTRKTRPPSRGTERSSGPSPSPSSRRQSSGSRPRVPKAPQTGSVRSAPPPGVASPDPVLSIAGLSESKLAMTPENIRPLLENAREVHARCADCILELRALLSTTTQVVGHPPAPAESHSRATSPIAAPPLPNP